MTPDDVRKSLRNAIALITMTQQWNVPVEYVPGRWVSMDNERTMWDPSPMVRINMDPLSDAGYWFTGRSEEDVLRRVEIYVLHEDRRVSDGRK